jgi:hypothetical protein
MKRTLAPHDLLALSKVQEVYKLSSGKKPLGHEQVVLLELIVAMPKPIVLKSKQVVHELILVLELVLIVELECESILPEA